MTLNPYFNNYNNQSEQKLFEDMNVEAINMFGLLVYYLPRNIVTRDKILREGEVINYEQAIPISVYFKSVDGWTGDGNFMSKFGLEIRNSVTLTAAMRSFRTETQTFRPMEGDLIYLPLNGKLFTIQFIDHENIFYQLGKLYTYDIPCELFEYSNEVFSTGRPEIDDKYNHYSNDLTNYHVQDAEGADIEAESGDFVLDAEYEIEDSSSMNEVVQEVADESLDFDELDPFGIGKY
jgi:hypothetical protein